MRKKGSLFEMIEEENPIPQAAQPDGNTRLSGSGLAIARFIWGFAIAASLFLFVVALPDTYRQVSTFQSVSGAEAQANVRLGLAQLGFTPTSLANYALALVIIRSVCVFLIIGLIIKGRPDDWMAMLSTFALSTFAIGRIVEQPADFQRLSSPEIYLLNLSFVAFLLLFYLFPDGRFHPRWTIWLAVISVILEVLFFGSAFPGSPLHAYTTVIQYPLRLVVLSLAIAVLVYRYRNFFSPVARQQVRWIVYAMVLVITIPILYEIPRVMDPSLRYGAPPGRPGVLYEMIAGPVMTAVILILPVSFAIAILRYRLWNIDLIINRSMVYVPLTAILAGLYTASVSLFQRLFIASTGQRSDAAFVISSLVLATTFTPIKNGLQASVDKRFKEPKDPLKALKDFDQQVQSIAAVIIPKQITRQLLDNALLSLPVKEGAVYLEQDGEMILAHRSEGWNGNVENGSLHLPLEYEGEHLGMLVLAARIDGADYTPQEQEILQQVIVRVAETIWWMRVRS